MLKILKNKTTNSIFIKDTGITIQSYSDYAIPSQDYWIWTASADTVSFIIADNLIVNDGEDDLPIRVGIALIQDNQIVINEHYTLIQDDGVLIGNGQILYFNDKFDTTDNVPNHIDEHIEDDNLTNVDLR